MAQGWRAADVEIAATVVIRASSTAATAISAGDATDATDDATDARPVGAAQA